MTAKFLNSASLAISILIMVAGFQNCSSKVNLSSEGSETSSSSGGSSPSSLTPGQGPSCFDKPGIERIVLTGNQSTGVEIPRPPSPIVIDARSAVSLTAGERALEIGDGQLVDNMCVAGFTVIGQQDRNLSWRTMHDDIGGSALRVYGSNYVVDGLRAENVQDGFDPRSGDKFELRNAWMTYVRDDCIENDELGELTVRDSLFDGCYTFLSEQESGSVVGETLLLENILVRLQPLPAPRGTEDPKILGHGKFFKKFDQAGRHQPIIRDSIFFMEMDCYSGCDDWPPGTKATNVTVVWTGPGDFPMSILPGMTLTRDRSVWDKAVQRWKVRHGCSTMNQPCTRLHTPEPL